MVLAKVYKLFDSTIYILDSSSTIGLAGCLKMLYIRTDRGWESNMKEDVKLNNLQNTLDTFYQLKGILFCFVV
jgi:hypothetical protein